VRFYADKSWIVQGVGFVLTSACLDLAEGKGCDPIWLDLWKKLAGGWWGCWPDGSVWEDMNAIVQRRTDQRKTDNAYLVNTSNLFVTQPRLLHDPAVLQRIVHTKAINLCLAGGNGIISTNDFRGDPVLTSFRWLPEQKMSLIVKLDQAETFAPIEDFRRLIQLIGGITLHTAMALEYGLAGTITPHPPTICVSPKSINRHHITKKSHNFAENFMLLEV